MKKWLPSVIVAGLLVSVPFNFVRAEEGSSAPMEGRGFHKGWEDGRNGLDLSKDQKSKFHALMEEEHKALKPLVRKLRDIGIKLHDQIEDKAGDSDIKATLADMKASHKALKEEMEKFKSEKENILTPTQQAKMALWRMKGHDRHEDGHDGIAWGRDHERGHHGEGKNSDDHED